MISQLPKKLFFRIEPILTSLMFYPASIKDRLVRQNPLTILMYHSIQEKLCGGPCSYYDLRITVEAFHRQMKYLNDNGFNIISLDEYAQARMTDRVLPPRPVVITFDDGYMDNYTNAYPVLKEFGFKATIFLAVDYINTGSPADFLSERVGITRDIQFLSWPKINEMSENGITFGSHSMSHKKLDLLTEDDFAYEISKSKDIIEEKTGKEVSSFCFPYAFPGGRKREVFCKLAREHLARAGYKLGVTTTIGRNTPAQDIFFLRRVPIHVNDSLRRFAAKLTGGYDWVRTFQSFAKSF